VSLVSIEKRGDGIAVLTLNRPKANAFLPELVDELSSALSSSEKARAVVLASAIPGIFSAGWDLPFLIDRDRKAMEGFVSDYCDLVRQIFVFGPPVVVALNGHAIAGGLIVAMAADERLAAEGKGKFGLSEIILGVSVPQCLMEPFRHGLGARVMERMAATGENLTVERALAVGLVDRVVPADGLLEAAVERATILAGLAPAAYAAIKRRSRAAAIARFDQARDHDPFLDYWFSEDARFRIGTWSRDSPESLRRCRWRSRRSSRRSIFRERSPGAVSSKRCLRGSTPAFPSRTLRRSSATRRSRARRRNPERRTSSGTSIWSWAREGPALRGWRPLELCSTRSAFEPGGSSAGSSATSTMRPFSSRLPRETSWPTSAFRSRRSSRRGAGGSRPRSWMSTSRPRRAGCASDSRAAFPKARASSRSFSTK
jgi:enoyl-CoA hydratase